MVSFFKIITLLVTAAFVAIAITNSIYFYRLYQSIYNTVPALRSGLFGANALTSSYAMWVVNLLLAIIAGMLFIFSLFVIAGVGKPGDDDEKSSSTNVVVVPAKTTSVPVQSIPMKSAPAQLSPMQGSAYSAMLSR